MNPLEQLIALFAAAAALVEKELSRSLARDAKASARGSARRRRLTEIRAVLAELRSKAIGAEDDPGLAWDVIRAGYERGLREAARTTREPGDVSTALVGIHLDAARALYASLADDLEQATLYVEKASSRTLRKVALNEVLVGQLAGRPQAKNAEAIAENLKSRGVRGFKDSKGREWKLERYAKMAASQAQSEAVTTAVLNRAVENGFDLVRISEHVNACGECRKYEGKVYSITGTTPGYPLLEVAPPYHPHCAHFPIIHVEMGKAPSGAVA